MARRNRSRGRYTPPLRALLVTDEIPDDASPAVREGLARRRLVATTGECPCGAKLRIPQSAFEPGARTVVPVEHEPDCPATDPNLRAAMEGSD